MISNLQSQVFADKVVWGKMRETPRYILFPSSVISPSSCCYLVGELLLRALSLPFGGINLTALSKTIGAIV